MATSLTSTGITFPDATTQTTAAVTTSNIGSAYAGVAYGAVGSLVYAYRYSGTLPASGSGLNAQSFVIDSTYTGSQLAYWAMDTSCSDNRAYSIGLSGTWRALAGDTKNGNTAGTTRNGPGLFVRIS